MPSVWSSLNCSLRDFRRIYMYLLRNSTNFACWGTVRLRWLFCPLRYSKYVTDHNTAINIQIMTRHISVNVILKRLCQCFDYCFVCGTFQTSKIIVCFIQISTIVHIHLQNHLFKGCPLSTSFLSGLLTSSFPKIAYLTFWKQSLLIMRIWAMYQWSSLPFHRVFRCFRRITVLGYFWK